jgi:hypothetical protein
MSSQGLYKVVRFRCLYLFLLASNGINPILTTLAGDPARIFPEGLLIFVIVDIQSKQGGHL